MLNRKRISSVPQYMIAPAAKKSFVSENTHSLSNDNCSMHAMASVSDNSLAASPMEIIVRCKDCTLGSEERCTLDCSSDDSDDSTCTVDSGVETDFVKVLAKPTAPLANCNQSDITKAKAVENTLQKDFFVRRMANLNARARVAVLFQSVNFKRRKKIPSPAEPSTENKMNESFHEAVKCSINTSGQLETQTVSSNKNPECTAKPEMVSDYDSHNSSLEASYIDSNLEFFPYNNIGLLYDGRTVHPCLRILLQDGKIPSHVIPSIVPAALSSVYEYVKHTINQELGSKVRRGDNGWSCYGEPIKVVQYRDVNDKLRTRKYYIGVKRNKEIIFVRNCICARSGTRKPYIAKVASIWQENGGIMMTLFWYYRAEEVHDHGINFVEGELLASQHYDDNTVACIEHKCYALGLSEYCRYKAGQMRQNDSSCMPNRRTLVPSYHRHEVASICQFWLPTLDTDDALVFLCYQGYNHITGRVIKPN